MLPPSRVVPTGKPISQSVAMTGRLFAFVKTREATGPSASTLSRLVRKEVGHNEHRSFCVLH